MEQIIQRNPKNLERSLFHFGLVKIIGEAKLQNQNDS
jgi:hypothetical protein